MPLSPSGVYTLPGGYLAVTGQDILPQQHNPPLEDIASVLSEAFYRTGVAPMLANLNMNTFKLLGVGNGTAATDAVNKSQLDGVVTASISGGSIRLIFPNLDYMLQMGSTVVNTDAGGSANITFPVPFSDAPASIVVSNGSALASTCNISLFQTWNAVAFGFTTTNPVATNGIVRVNWAALGAKT